MSRSEVFREAATNLADCLRELASRGLVVWSQGNASVLLDDHGVVLIKASDVLCEEASLEDISVVDLETGNATSLDGGTSLIPSTDVISHLYIYKSVGWYPEHPVKAIIHTHSVNATALAAFGTDILPVTTGIANSFGDSVSCLPYAEIGDVAIGRGFVDYYQYDFGKAVLLEKHGVLTVGLDLEEAFKNAIMTENSAEVYIKALSVASSWGRNLSCLTPEQIKSNYNRSVNRR